MAKVIPLEEIDDFEEDDGPMMENGKAVKIKKLFKSHKGAVRARATINKIMVS